MVRSTLALVCSLSLFGASAFGQALHGPGFIGGNGGMNATDFVDRLQTGQLGQGNGSTIAQSSYFATYGNNNGFGYYAPAYAVGATGLGLPGLNGLNSSFNGLYNYNNIAVGYGANALSPLLLGRTIGNSNYYGNPVLTNVPYGVSNLYQLMPNQNVGITNANTRQFSGPKTNPGQGVAGAARGNSEASAILNGAMSSRENPRAARKAKAGARRNLARRAP